MSELVDRARYAYEWGSGDQLHLSLADEVERLEDLIAHWKALWRGTVEDSTKVIQERDEALREVERLRRIINGRDTMNCCMKCGRPTHSDDVCGECFIGRRSPDD